MISPTWCAVLSVVGAPRVGCSTSWGPVWDLKYPPAQLWLTPGHSEEDASLVVRADDAVYALTHLWWRADRTPAEDPFAPDQSVLDAQRERVLAAVDIVIPGHDGPFRVEK